MEVIRGSVLFIAIRSGLATHRCTFIAFLSNTCLPTRFFCSHINKVLCRQHVMRIARRIEAGNPACNLQLQLSSSATQSFIPTSQSRSAVTQILFSQQIEFFQVSTMTSRTAGIPKAEYRRKKKNRHKANKRAANKMLSLFADMTLASTISISSIEDEHESANKAKPTTKTKRSKAGVEKRRTRSSKSRMAKAADHLGKLALNIDNLENNKDDRDIEQEQKSST